MRQFAGEVDGRRPVAVVNVSAADGGKDGRPGDSHLALWVGLSVRLSDAFFLSLSVSHSRGAISHGQQILASPTATASLPPPSIDGRLSFETEVERENERAQFNPANEIGFQAVYPRAFLRFFPCFRFLPSPSHSPPVLIPVHDLVLAKPKIMRASNFMCFVLNGTEVSISRHFV